MYKTADSGLPRSRTRSDLNLTRLPKECLPGFSYVPPYDGIKKTQITDGKAIKAREERYEHTFVCVPAAEGQLFVILEMELICLKTSVCPNQQKTV